MSGINTASSNDAIINNIMINVIVSIKSLNGTFNLESGFFLRFVMYAINRTSIFVTSNAPHNVNIFVMIKNMLCGISSDILSKC